jgi:putative transposase
LLILRLVLRITPDDDTREREAEILVLRHQLAVLKRASPRPRIRRLDRMMIAAFARLVRRDRWSGFIVSPATILRWHREIVARKWTYRRSRIGRPPLDPSLGRLIVQMARDNPRWGIIRIKGELQGLGYRVGATTIRSLLRRAGIPPAPRRTGPSWSEFLRAQAKGVMSCDLFSVETVFLRTLYVLFFIDVRTRRLRIAGVTANPDAGWVTQQARNLAMDGEADNIRFLIRDRDSKFTASFDEVFRSEGARTSCSWSVAGISSGLLRDYEAHYNSHRPHRGIDLNAPERNGFDPRAIRLDEIERTAVVSGLINEYQGEAA